MNHKRARQPCPVCGNPASDHGRTAANRIIWCPTHDTTWPIANLKAKVGGRRALCERLGIRARSLPHDLTDVQADRWAIRCGYHPTQVWPDWDQAGLTYVDSVFVEQGGWRPAWLHQETTATGEVQAP